MINYHYITARNKYIPKQCTALYLACKEGHAKCVEELLTCQANVTYSTHDHKDIKSCLEIAILKRKR